MWTLLKEDLNFLVTNRIPRRWLTLFMAWFSQIEQPLVRDLSIRTWRMFCDLDLSEARSNRFASMHDCFIRELRPGVRPVDPDPDILVSPCDAIVGACGRICDGQLFQAKGYPYALEELLGDADPAPWRDACYVTLRITAAMYHRFHAPAACQVRGVTYISGDTWNVNPISLQRIQRLFCRNERVVIEAELLPQGPRIALVAVAAILVASIRLHFADVLLHLRYAGSNRIPCDARLERGQEMGWFQHGSTIILLAPAEFRLAEGVAEGRRVRVGEALLRLSTIQASGC